MVGQNVAKTSDGETLISDTGKTIAYPGLPLHMRLEVLCDREHLAYNYKA